MAIPCRIAACAIGDGVLFGHWGRDPSGKREEAKPKGAARPTAKAPSANEAARGVRVAVGDRGGWQLRPLAFTLLTLLHTTQAHTWKHSAHESALDSTGTTGHGTRPRAEARPERGDDRALSGPWSGHSTLATPKRLLTIDHWPTPLR